LTRGFSASRAAGVRLMTLWRANSRQTGELHQDDRQQEIDKTSHFLSFRFHSTLATLEEQPCTGTQFLLITAISVGIGLKKLNIPIIVPICTPTSIFGEEFRNTTPTPSN